MMQSVDNLFKCHEELTGRGYKIGLVGPQDFDKETKELNKARLKKGKYRRYKLCIVGTDIKLWLIDF